MSKAADRFRRLAENKEGDNPNSNKTEVINKIVGVDGPPLTKNTVTEPYDDSLKNNSNTENTNVSVNINTENEEGTGIININTVTEQSNVTVKTRTSTAARIPRPIEEFEKSRKLTIEETHRRGTYLIRNDLLKRLEKLAKNQQRGFKTHLINYALELILDEIEAK